MNDALTAVLVVVVAAGGAIVLVEAVHLTVARIGRRSPNLADLARKAHRSFRAMVVVYAVEQALRSGIGDFTGRAWVLHILLILIIAASAWLVADLLLVSRTPPWTGGAPTCRTTCGRAGCGPRSSFCAG